MLDHIQSRRAELQALLDRARLTYADLEEQRDRAVAQLAELQRHLDGMAGGLQELDALLSVAPVLGSAQLDPLAMAMPAPGEEIDTLARDGDRDAGDEA